MRVCWVLVLAACGQSSGSGEPVVEAKPAVPVDAAVPADAAPAPSPAVISAAPCFETDVLAPVDHAGSDKLTLTPAKFADLPGWADDKHAEVLPALNASCEMFARLPDAEPVGVDGFSGRARDWRAACAAAKAIPPGDHAAARRFFETELAAYTATGRAGADGKMTGYNVTPLRGSRTRKGKYQTPIWGRPPDLVMVDLTKFIPDARARKLWGRNDGGSLIPMPTRAEIRHGALAGRGLELLWVDDPIDALFVNIEGSGQVHLDDGSSARIEFAGKNGRAYRGVADVIRSLGGLPKGQGTMQGIRAWFKANPDKTDLVLDQIASMVFFKISPHPGAMGTQGVVLTARRSVAVDRNFVALGTPLWIDTRAPIPRGTGSAAWQHLVVAQDTGGGIKGAVRADIFWGDDEDAADLGGRMGGKGRYWVLLPKRLEVR